MTTLSIRPQRDNADFQLVARSFLLEKGLPLAHVLPAAEIERIFRRHDAIFGDTYNSVYNTAVVLWAFLSQVLADGKMRSCAAAVSRVGNFLITVGKNPPSTDTGEYCTARKKRDEKALHDLVTEAAGKIEHATPHDWLWCGRVAAWQAASTDQLRCTCQYVLATWMRFSADRAAGHDIRTCCETLLCHIASCEVANRPGRIEPRVLKRRRHRYPLMQEPRAVLKAKLQNCK